MKEKSRKRVPIKLVVVGDVGTGKSTLLMTFFREMFDDTFVSPVVDTQTKVIQVENTDVELSLVDTAGQKDFDNLRPLSYVGADVILMCFSVENRTSFGNILGKWTPEVARCCQSPTVTVILVGNKRDLRSDQVTLDKLADDKIKPVMYEEGIAMAKLLKCAAYLECSAKTFDGVVEVFERAAILSLEKKNAARSERVCGICHSGFCSIM